MGSGDLAVVEAWQEAVNEADPARLRELSAVDVEIMGPRGSGRGGSLLEQWLQRAGVTLTALRWFCGGDGRVVVEQWATWRSPETGSVVGEQRVASRYQVGGGVVTAFGRHDDLSAALATAGLNIADEVTARG
jgi:hypothetical protein